MLSKKIAIFMIRGYRLLVRPLLKGQCRFYPHCSLYAEVAIERYGVLYGCWLILKRLLKCHPWYTDEEYDPVPEITTKKGVRIFYDR